MDRSPLTLEQRRTIAREVVEMGHSARSIARKYETNEITVRKWATRYRERGEAGLESLSRAPHKRRKGKYSATLKALRLIECGMSAVKAAKQAGISRSTIYRWLADLKTKP